MDNSIIISLVDEARLALRNAYAPYSKFPVGAALLTKSGRIYRGCNIESAAFGAGVCAERTAIFSAIANGDREFEAIAVIADTEKPCAPCGICRQVLMEFGPHIMVIRANMRGAYDINSADYYLPEAFTNLDLNKSNKTKQSM